MNANDITHLFGLSVEDSKVESLFVGLGTMRRPELPEDEEMVFHDWVLVKRKGVELGFADSEYHAASPGSAWGKGKLILTQVYFYSGFDDIKPFTGELPYGLKFEDSREMVRVKLNAFETTRHSYLNDTWDVDGYRLSVTYKDGGKGIDRMACRALAAPMPRKKEVLYPSIKNISESFGSSAGSPEFKALWGGFLDDAMLRDAREDGAIDFLESFGAILGIAGQGKKLVFNAITLHRNRHNESAGWDGELPLGLDFEDSPEMLFSKIKQKTVQQSDDTLTGHAVWHFKEYTLHILYSNLDNRLLHVKMIAPGVWKSVMMP